MKKSKPPKDFAAFILTHGRPDSQDTYDSLRREGYTGPIYLIIDDIDSSGPKYKEKYGEQVIVFDKKAWAKRFDTGNNFNNLNVCAYARNACWEIAKKLKIKYFIQLDDDYWHFHYKFDQTQTFRTNPVRYCKDLNGTFSAMLEFWKQSGAASIALAQEGDFVFSSGHHIYLRRKCMNSWICGVDRPFIWTGTMNEDVTTYVINGSRGLLFFTMNQIAIQQPPTQTQGGGMTDIYKAQGTYVKSFYTVMYHPSSVKIGRIRGKSGEFRIHHNVKWVNTVPKIIRENLKKTS